MRHTPQIIYERLHIKYGQKYLFKIIGEYQNQKTRIECRCNLCGYIWDVSCGVAMSGKAGCKRCSNRLKPTLTEAKQKLTEASQGRYIFELTEYKNAKQRVKCKCNTCGHEWFNKYENLIYRKDGCEKCSLVKTHTKQTMSQNDATTRMNNVSSKNHFKWKFKNGIYETIRTRILCECDVCGYKWESNFSAIVYRNTGCRNCFFVKQSERQRFTQEQVYNLIAQVSQNRYKFKILDLYQNAKCKIKCQCTKCGFIWSSTFRDLYYRKSACPNLCYQQHSYVSSPEHEITDFIKQNFPQLEIQQSVKSILKNLKGNHWMELDIYIPEAKLAIEFNGTYWHSNKIMLQKHPEFESAQQYHDYKTQQCALKGIKLIHIDEQDYKKSQNDVLRNIQLQIQEQI